MVEKKWTGVIGLMSGTSLDGLDCCYAEFNVTDGVYKFRNTIAHTYPYSDTWRQRLKQAFYLPPAELAALDLEFGAFLAEKVNLFLTENMLQSKTELIASHGHTVFHDPSKKQTVQIGNGDVLNRQTGLKVINDFRITDVLLGGQGAPLVPVGDHFLFSAYEACLNLGGFSNISFVLNNQRIAFDIGPCNLPINQLCKKYLQCEFDKGGLIAASGTVIPALLEALNSLPFYTQKPPKSLGVEWLNAQVQPLIDQYMSSKPQDLIATLTQHAATQINVVLDKYQLKAVLVTGGGAYNTELINHLQNRSTKIILPSPEIIDFKEALIFAFLGYLNFNNSINTFKSVTGAREDSIGGIRHFGHQH
ncbi:MAG: anhydro-N-acetylmuramic acid kinase [Bacteroidetes bacterium]|nr:anhydro-N-acetylmuramic acid kinase [Bacteroidota bacterium]